MIYCFLILLRSSISKIVHSMPSRIPIWEPIPSDRSIMKNITAQKGAPGSSTMAWVKTIKAKPVPWAAYNTLLTQIQQKLKIRTPSSSAAREHSRIWELFMALSASVYDTSEISDGFMLAKCPLLIKNCLLLQNHPLVSVITNLSLTPVYICRRCSQP